MASLSCQIAPIYPPTTCLFSVMTSSSGKVLRFTGQWSFSIVIYACVFVVVVVFLFFCFCFFFNSGLARAIWTWRNVSGQKHLAGIVRKSPMIQYLVSCLCSRILFSARIPPWTLLAQVSKESHSFQYSQLLSLLSDCVCWTLCSRRNYVLLQDVLDDLNISRAALTRKVKRLEIREMPWSEFVNQLSASQVCVRPQSVPPNCSTREALAELLPLTFTLRRLLGIKLETVSITWLTALAQCSAAVIHCFHRWPW